MMEYSVRVTEYQGQPMLNICDADILGKDIVQGDLVMHISEGYYGGRIVGIEEAESLLQGSAIINMAGKETVAASLRLGIGSQDAVRTISDVPFLIIFNM